MMSAVVARVVSGRRARLCEGHDRAVHEAHESEHHGHRRAEQTSPGCAHGSYMGYEFHSRQHMGKNLDLIIPESTISRPRRNYRPCNSYASGDLARSTGRNLQVEVEVDLAPSS